MQLFKAVEMSTIYDVCLNTYGNLDNLVKLMTDNNFPGVNFYPWAFQLFTYDETLVYGLVYQTKSLLQNDIYATRPQTTTNETTMSNYSQTSAASYTTTEAGESPISFSGVPAGATVIRVDLEVKPLAPSEWSWNPTSGILTFTDPSIIFANQLVSIIYTQLITS